MDLLGDSNNYGPRPGSPCECRFRSEFSRPLNIRHTDGEDDKKGVTSITVTDSDYNILAHNSIYFYAQ